MSKTRKKVIKDMYREMDIVAGRNILSVQDIRRLEQEDVGKTNKPK